MKKGYVHVITGGGKGKTTSAVGLAVRARSRGLRVFFGQFMKLENGGEVSLLRRLGVEVEVFERVLSPFFHPEADRSNIRAEALKALERLIPRLGGFDLVVLDEFNCLLGEGILTPPEAVRFIKDRPEGVELVLTGVGAPQELVSSADYAVEVDSLKHPSGSGLPARPGIEY